MGKAKKVYVVTHAIDSRVNLLGVGDSLESAKTVASDHATCELTWELVRGSEVFGSNAWQAYTGFRSYEINEQELVCQKKKSKG